MPDGSSGYIPSEVISAAAKQMGTVVKKQAGGVIGQIKKQVLGGSFGSQQQQQQSQQRPNDSMISKLGGGSFDIGALGKAAKQQVAGTNIPTSGSFIPGKTSSAAQPPGEGAPKQGGGFDMNSFFGEDSPFGKTIPKNSMPQQQMPDPQLAAQMEQQKAQEKQQMEMLRKKLHDIYFEEFQRKAEGRDQNKQAEEQKKMQEAQSEEERKRQEKEAQMNTIEMSSGPQKGQQGQKKKSGFSLMKLMKPKQGSHEGKSGKG